MRHLIRFRLSVLIACLAILAGCGEDHPTAPGLPPSTGDGAWTGTLVDRARGSGRVQLTLQGLGVSAIGTFAITFGDAAYDLAGEASASTADAPTVDLFLLARNTPGCPANEPLVVHARVTVTGDRMTGTYTYIFPCSQPPGSGTIEATRR